MKTNQSDETRTDETENIDDDNDTSITDVGYDGQLVPNYGKISIGFTSESVLGQIVSLSREYILSFWGVTSSGQRSEMGRIVEDLFWQDLRTGYKMRVFSMKEKNASVLDFGNCAIIDETVDMKELGQKVFDREDRVIARMCKNAALCDFAGPHRTVFQVTVSDQHTISKQGLEELLISSGHVRRMTDKAIKKSENADRIEKVSLYWVVPPSRLEHWKKKVPKKILKRTNGLLKECLERYVEQYVLVIDIDPTEVNSMPDRDN